MAKKCVSAFGAVMCMENMTVFVLFLLIISVGYLYYKQFSGNKHVENKIHIYDIYSHKEPDPIYNPPLNTIDIRGEPQSNVRIGVPVNIRTSTADTSYRQIGILTKNSKTHNGTEPIILPLFGRNLLNGRDKWQYYTMANSGGVAFNAKLPISVNGRSCTSEYGCDSVSNGDVVYVEGYDDTFRATIYENSHLNYIPL